MENSLPRIAPQFGHFPFSIPSDVYAVDQDGPRRQTGRIGQQFQNAATQDNFAAAGFPDNGQHLAFVQRKTHVPDSLHRSRRRIKMDGQMTDLQHWFHGSSPLLTGQRDCVQSR